ncbi:16S rRNA (uracil(1498)-N(3))-methyltransferase [Thermodesulfovibrio sp. 3907-1M]|uniref:Ribosomal RNA small subunit methyltransferase E n=1 Tax=Thermodesulfovibrio autotrophicus TaxID=3118333 RepID=A0AAU8GXL0_9BACT
MSNPRLCIQYSEIFPGKNIELSREDRRYIFNVLRCHRGDIISIFDGKGKSFKARIIDDISIEVLEEEKLITEDAFSLSLCQALLKGEKMEMVIQKATELGVKKIIPFVSERCVIKETRKTERWRKIAKEASEQAQRSIVPEINDVIFFSELIKKIKNGILFWEKAETPLIQIVSDINPHQDVFLLIGPEGGFTQKEVTQAAEKNIKIATLGKRILKAETASIVAVSLVSFLLEWKFTCRNVI